MALFRCGNNGGSSTPSGTFIAVECPNNVLPEDYRNVYADDAYIPVISKLTINNKTINANVDWSASVANVGDNVSATGKLNGGVIGFNKNTYTITLSNIGGTCAKEQTVEGKRTTLSGSLGGNISYQSYMIIDTSKKL